MILLSGSWHETFPSVPTQGNSDSRYQREGKRRKKLDNYMMFYDTFFKRFHLHCMFGKILFLFFYADGVWWTFMCVIHETISTWRFTGTRNEWLTWLLASSVSLPSNGKQSSAPYAPIVTSSECPLAISQLALVIFLHWLNRSLAPSFWFGREKITMSNFIHMTHSTIFELLSMIFILVIVVF